MSDTIAQPSYLATRRGKATLALLAAVGFLDFVDASIVNIALPNIHDDLDFSVQGLQWVISGYLLTYGGFMLLGGRLADLLGRRRVLVGGTVVFAVASLAGALAQDAEVLVGARLVQGLGAAVMMPAALSLLTTSFSSGSDRPKALGVWGGVGGLASALGVFLGGVLTEGPGWRWVLAVNPPIAVLLLVGIFVLIPADRPEDHTEGFDLAGAVLITTSMLTLVHALVEAPDRGWSDSLTITELAASAVLLVAFVVVELRSHSPLVPLSIFRTPGLAAADVTQLVGVGGFVTMFFFLTLYMQNVLGFTPLETGSAYLPLALVAGVSAGIGTGLIGRIGTRPVIVAGALIVAGGLALLSRIPVDGSYLGDLLPGMLVVAFGIGAVFVGTTTAANAGVPPSLAGLAAALVNSSQQIGGALGLAIFSAIATARTSDLLADGRPMPDAMTAGFQRALLAAAIFLAVAALVALRTRNTRGEHAEEALIAAAAVPEMS
jgi:EmrB/QacA subfamily drug resistance transporter